MCVAQTGVFVFRLILFLLFLHLCVQHFTNEECKRVYYMSLEFLMGRSLQNAYVALLPCSSLLVMLVLFSLLFLCSIFNLDLTSEYAQALEDFGYHLEDLYEEVCVCLFVCLRECSVL